MADWVAMAGSAPAFVRESVVAVIPGATDALDAIARFEAAALPVTLAEALDLVVAGGPLTSAPSFFVAVRDAQQWRCAVRGAITVTIDGTEHIQGDSASTWLEFIALNTSPLEVEVREAGSVSWLPVGHGPARVGALRRTPESAQRATPTRSPKPTAAASSPGPGPASPPAAEHDVSVGTVIETEASGKVDVPIRRESVDATIAGAPPEADAPSAASRYDDLFGDLTVAGGVAAAAVLESASVDPDAVHVTDTATGFDHSEVAVSAILCSQQHPNPPERGRCWRCATTLESRSIVRVARPALGSVALDDGRVIEIDRTVLLGRNPRAERTDAAHLPALISVGSEAAGVSRTHARIFLEGWQVLVEDLGSTFGSTLIGADGATRQLRPGQPELVNGDSVLDLGGGSRVRLVGVP